MLGVRRAPENRDPGRIGLQSLHQKGALGHLDRNAPVVGVEHQLPPGPDAVVFQEIDNRLLLRREGEEALLDVYANGVVGKEHRSAGHNVLVDLEEGVLVEAGSPDNDKTPDIRRNLLPGFDRSDLVVPGQPGGKELVVLLKARPGLIEQNTDDVRPVFHQVTDGAGNLVLDSLRLEDHRKRRGLLEVGDDDAGVDDGEALLVLLHDLYLLGHDAEVLRLGGNPGERRVDYPDVDGAPAKGLVLGQ